MPPENVKTRLRESNVPPLNNDFESYVPQLFILDSRTFVAKSALSRFWGALLAKIWWEGAQKHFKGPGSGGHLSDTGRYQGGTNIKCEAKVQLVSF